MTLSVWRFTCWIQTQMAQMYWILTLYLEVRQRSVVGRFQPTPIPSPKKSYRRWRPGSGAWTLRRSAAFPHGPRCHQLNPLEYKGNYIAGTNRHNMKLVCWPMIGGLLHLVQRGWDWAGTQPTQSSPRCTKCNSPLIDGQSTNHRIAVRCSAVLMCPSISTGLSGGR